MLAFLLTYILCSASMYPGQGKSVRRSVASGILPLTFSMPEPLQTPAPSQANTQP